MDDPEEDQGRRKRKGRDDNPERKKKEFDPGNCSLTYEDKSVLIGDPALIDAKLQALEYRRRVARLSGFYTIHFGECAKELHEFHHPLSAIGKRGAGDRSIDMLLICHLDARADLVFHS